MQKCIVYILLLLLLFASCDGFLITAKEESKTPIARVYDQKLYTSDIEEVLTSNFTKQDSLQFIENYINSWAKKQLLLHQSEINLKKESKAFEKLVEDYRSTLYINAYKEALILSKLDTVVSDYQIEKYYVANHDNFKLNEELVQIKYLHTDNNRADKKGLIKLFKSKKAEDVDSLQLRILEFKSYNFNDSIWIKYSDLIGKINYLKNENKKTVLKKSSFIQKEDALGLYLMIIKDVLKRNDIAPISYVSPTIEQIILHKRKLELLRKIEVDLLDDAIKSQKFEKY